MKDPIKLDWQPASTTPTTDDLPVAVFYPSMRTVCVYSDTVKGLDGLQWAQVRFAAPDEQPEAKEARPADDPLNDTPVILAIREAMIAASNATSAEQARRWFNDRYLEVMGDKQ
jgi:hypothetical protein